MSTHFTVTYPSDAFSVFRLTWGLWLFILVTDVTSQQLERFDKQIPLLEGMPEGMLKVNTLSLFACWVLLHSLTRTIAKKHYSKRCRYNVLYLKMKGTVLCWLQNNQRNMHSSLRSEQAVLKSKVKERVAPALLDWLLHNAVWTE